MHNPFFLLKTPNFFSTKQRVIFLSPYTPFFFNRDISEVPSSQTIVLFDNIAGHINKLHQQRGVTVETIGGLMEKVCLH
jgi:hypothetical protein